MGKQDTQWGEWNKEQARWRRRLDTLPPPSAQDWFYHIRMLEATAPRTRRGKLNLHAVDYLGHESAELADMMWEEVSRKPSERS